MYGIFPYIYHKNQPNVGKYMNGMGTYKLGVLGLETTYLLTFDPNFQRDIQVGRDAGTE